MKNKNYIDRSTVLKLLKQLESSKYSNLEAAKAINECIMEVMKLPTVTEEKKSWEINTREIDVKEIFNDMLDYFGYDENGRDIGVSRGIYFYQVEDISINQARSIKRYFDKIMNVHDKFCDMKYDKASRTGRYDIAS